MKLLCLFSLPQLGFRVHAFFITTTPKMQRHRSKFTHPLWSPQNDWTDQSSTNNKVWVTWKSPASGEFVADKIRELNDRAMIKDLRREFVKQQYLQNIDHADVKVREKKNGQVLEEDAFLKQYFVPPEGRGEGPGQSKKTALFLTLPRPNVQQPQFQVSVSIMIQLFLRRNLGYTKMLAFFSHCQCRMCISSNR